MSRCLRWIAGAALLTMASGAWSQKNVVEIVAKGCNTEIRTHCSQVTPGQGRILSCLYAHNDKLSGQCEFALYDAAAQLERAVAALTYVANECDEDIDKLCARVIAGEGRILACLDEHSAKLAPRCSQALSDVGLK